MPFDSQFDYKKIIKDARTPVQDPQGNGQGTAVELPKLFEGEPKPPPVMSSEVSEDKISIEAAMRQFSKVFVIWRDWEECSRCSNDMEGDNPKVVLPDEGDYTCPHVNRREYKEIVDKCLSGDGVITLKESFNLQNGNRCVHLEWMEADAEAMRKIKRRAEEKKKNQVWPPDVEGAFAKDKPPK